MGFPQRNCPRMAMRSRTLGWWVGWTFVFPFLGAEALAQDPDTTPVPLPPLVVRGAASGELLSGAAGVRWRPDSVGLTPGTSLDRLLRETPSLVRVRDNSRGEVEIALRGLESRHVAVLWDGVPLSLGWDHRIDLSLVPLDGVERVEVVRGLSSLLSGPNVLAGGVALSSTPTRAPTPPTARLRVARDGDGWAYGLAATSAAGPGALRVSLAHRRSSGWTLPASLRDLDGGRRRLGSEGVQTNAAAVWRLGADTGPWLQASAAALAAERGVPPELHTSSPRFWRYPTIRRGLGAIGAGTGFLRTAWGVGDLETTLGVVDGVVTLDSYADARYDRVTAREHAEERSAVARLLAEHLAAGVAVRAAVTHGDLRRLERLEPGGTNRYRQRLTSVAAEVEVAGSLWSGALGVAWDRAASPQAGPFPPNPAVDAWGTRAVAQWAPSSTVTLHAGWQQRARFPSLRELYSGALGRFVPNPSLGPERLRALEAGVRWRGHGVEAQLAAFHQHLADAIVRVGLGGGRFQRINRDALRTRGVEAIVGGMHGPVQWRAEGLRQWVRLREPTRARPPEHQPEWLLGAETSARLTSRLQASVLTQHTGRQWCLDPDSGDPIALGSHTRWDLGLRHGAARNWPFEFRLEMRNVFDAATYDQCGLPQPGRSLRLQLDLVAP